MDTLVSFARMLALWAILAFPAIAFGDACVELRDSVEIRRLYREEAGVCATNVYKVLQALQQKGYPLEDYDVLAMIGRLRTNGLNGPSYLGQIEVHGARSGSDRFNFHFLILNRKTGNVLDLEFPAVTGNHIDAYAKATYGSEQLSTIQVKRLGAQQYIDLANQYGATRPEKMRGFMEKLRGYTEQWPQTSLQDVANQFGH